MMERAALRLATVAALLNGGVGPPWPTLANEFVYDSMIDDIIDVVPVKRRPVIIVRTDEDQLLFSKNTVTGRQVRLLIEISVVSSVEGPGGVSKLDWPKTDAALELLLDILEWQVYNALLGMTEWGSWYRDVMEYATMLNYTSVPRFAPPDRGAVRLAVRMLEYTQRLPPECLVPPLHELGPEQPPFLPLSIVRVVNKILADGGGDFKTAVTGFAKVLHTYAEVQQPRLPALQRVWADFPQYEFSANWPIEQAATVEEAELPIQAPVVGMPDVN